MVKFHPTVRSARIEAVKTTIGPSPHLIFYSGSATGDPTSADPVGPLATLILPSEWESAASSGASALVGTWTGLASDTGTISSWRLKDAGETFCGLEGTVAPTGVIPVGDMTMDNPAVVIGQTIVVNSFGQTDGNAAAA